MITICQNYGPQYGQYGCLLKDQGKDREPPKAEKPSLKTISFLQRNFAKKIKGGVSLEAG